MRKETPVQKIFIARAAILSYKSISSSQILNAMFSYVWPLCITRYSCIKSVLVYVAFTALADRVLYRFFLSIISPRKYSGSLMRSPEERDRAKAMKDHKGSMSLHQHVPYRAINSCYVDVARRASRMHPVGRPAMEHSEETEMAMRRLSAGVLERCITICPVIPTRRVSHGVEISR